MKLNNVRSFTLNQKGVVHYLIPILLILGIIGGVYLITAGPLKLKPKASVSGPVGPSTALTLSPNLNNVGVGNTVGVKVLVRSDVAAVNLFTAKIKYPKDLLSVEKIDYSDSIVKNWVEQFSDNATGDISLVGGVPNPGFVTNSGGTPSVMAVIYFRAIKAGSAAISFTDESAVYDNANNLNILSQKVGTTLAIGAGSTSLPTPTSTPTNTPTPSPVSQQRRVFVTSTKYNGNLGGLPGADAKCQDRANTANLGGTWKAWLSDSNTLVSNRLEHATVPYKLLDGTVVANNWNELISGGLLQSPINRTEYNAVSKTGVWTGTRFDTSKSPYTLTNPAFSNCSNWTQAVPVGSRGGNGSIGISYERHSVWTYSADFFCDLSATAALYCFEQGAPAATPAPSTTPLPGTGDGNNNGKTDLGDMSVLLTDFNKTTGFRKPIDMNGDGKINTFDFSLMRNLLIQKGVIRG